MRLLRPSASILARLLSVTAAVAGCSGDPVAVEVPAPGEPAEIVLTEIEWAGGRESRRETRIDSAAKRFTVRTCDGAPIGVACITFRTESSGEVVTPSVQTLFLDTKTSAFRALKPEYPRQGSVVPPDPGTAVLEITRDGLRRSILWDETATLPNVLAEFICSLQAARGALILCSKG